MLQQNMLSYFVSINVLKDGRFRHISAYVLQMFASLHRMEHHCAVHSGFNSQMVVGGKAVKTPEIHWNTIFDWGWTSIDPSIPGVPWVPSLSMPDLPIASKAFPRPPKVEVNPWHFCPRWRRQSNFLHGCVIDPYRCAFVYIPYIYPIYSYWYID